MLHLAQKAIKLWHFNLELFLAEIMHWGTLKHSSF